MGEEASVVVKKHGRTRRESNPLLVKELRGRMRGARAFVVLTVYLLLLSCFTTAIYYAYVQTTAAPGGGMEMAYLGKAVFYSVVVIEVFMVTFITPAFTAGAITGEREHKTYEALCTTLLSARGLVGGKLTSALTYMFLLILAAVPLESLAFILGGVIVEEVVLALVILLVTAFTFGAVGLFFSSFVRTTLASTVLSYTTALLVTIGLPLLVLIFAGFLVDPLMYSSTAPTALQIVLVYAFYFAVSASPLTAAAFTEVTLTSENTIWYSWTYLGPGRPVWIPSAWTVFVVIYLLVALALLLVTVLRVRRQETR